MNDSWDKRSLARRLWRPFEEGPNILSTTFSQPIGTHLRPDEVHGYYIDMSVKADTPTWPTPWFRPGGVLLWVGVVQWALGCHERYLSGDGDRWLDGAVAAADQLLAEQETDGAMAGGWLHHFPYPHTYDLRPPWMSGIVQGEAASLLVRMADLTSDERYAAAARAALRPMRVPSAAGGVAATLDGGFLCEEYPTAPPSYVLNGAIFALWGLRDVAMGLDDSHARELFDEGLRTLESNLHRYDTGYWSRYDLFPHRVLNVASRAYHELHIDQLRATALITGRPTFDEWARRFEAYMSSPIAGARAFSRKALFRVAVPRRRRPDPGRLPSA